MLKALIAGVALALAACATQIALTQSPEQQILIGTRTVTATTTLATVLLRDHKITVTQAKSYRNMLVAAGESLKDADTELVACRRTTGPAPAIGTDPCWPTVSDVVTIALENVAGVKKALEAK